MQVTETLSDGLRRGYTVVVPAAEIERKTGAKLQEIGKTIRLPGFRPGKVPVKLVRQRYGASVLAEVMQDALNSAAEQLVEERNLRPAGQPRISLTGQPEIDKAEASDLAFNVELDLLPDITPPDLATLELVRLRAEVQPEKLEETLTTIAKQQRDVTPVDEDRPAAKGDVLTVDFEGSVDGVPFEGGASQDARVEIGGEGFIPGFSEGMEGMKQGESRDVAVTFPTPYHNEALAGKAAIFKVTAKALGTPAPAEVNDAFATKLGFESLDKLRETINQQMQRELDQMARLRLKRELLDKLAERANFPSPQNLVDIEFDAIWRRVEADTKAGQVDDEDKGKDEATLKAEYRAIADRRVRLGLLLSEIGRGANIQVTQQELTQALRTEAARYPGQEMQVVEFFRKQPGAIEQLRGPIFEDKVVDYIVEMAKVEDKIVPAEELALPPAEFASETPKLTYSQEPASAEAQAENRAAAAGEAPDDPAGETAEPAAEHNAAPAAEAPSGT
jgi:trigger factor